VVKSKIIECFATEADTIQCARNLPGRQEDLAAWMIKLINKFKMEIESADLSRIR